MRYPMEQDMIVIETIEIDGLTFEIIRKKNGRLAAYCNGEEQCHIHEGYDCRKQLKEYIEKAY